LKLPNCMFSSEWYRSAKAFLSSHKLQLACCTFEDSDKPCLDGWCPNLLIKEKVALTPSQGETLEPCS